MKSEITQPKPIEEDKLIYSSLFRRLSLPADEKVLSFKAGMLFNIFSKNKLDLYTGLTPRDYGKQLNRYLGQELAQNLLWKTIPFLDSDSAIEFSLVSKTNFCLIHKFLAVQPEQIETLFTKTRGIILAKDDETYQKYYSKKANFLTLTEVISVIAIIYFFLAALIHYKMGNHSGVSIAAELSLASMFSSLYTYCLRLEGQIIREAWLKTESVSLKHSLQEFKDSLSQSLLTGQLTTLIAENKEGQILPGKGRR